MTPRDACVELQRIVETLSQPEKTRLNQDLFKHRTELEGIIEKEVDIDSTHLTLVNFCANPFMAGSGIESGYWFIRTDPLLSFEVGNFDLLIYGPGTNIAILVECKSSVSRASKVVADIMQKTRIAEENKSLLGASFGEEIDTIEPVLCVCPADIADVRGAITNLNAPIRIWSADRFQNCLFLMPRDEDRNKDFQSRGIHRDLDLTALLINKVQVQPGSLRGIRFQATSHMAKILSELFSRVWADMQRRDMTQFSGDSVLTIVKDTLTHHSDEEIANIVQRGLQAALGVGIVLDESPDESDLLAKEFSFNLRSPYGEKILKAYIEAKAKQLACEKLLEETKTGGLSKYLPKE
jgi:hypothetical protein